jgi:peroxiredoxin Q/BCP
MIRNQKPGNLINAKEKIMPIPKEDNLAPDFSLPASNGKTVSLKDFRGNKNVVLYFYPKDDTPGCTIEACGFRDTHSKFEDNNTMIFGISPDGVTSHNKFITKFKLPFILLSDEDKKTCENYGVWVEKNMYGKKYMGVARTTIVIGKDGKIAKVFEKVNPKDHEKEVLTVIKTLK